MMAEYIPPLVDWIGPHAVEHGERGEDLDLIYPTACLCGEPDYLMCPHPGIETWVFTAHRASGPPRTPF